MIEVQLPDGSQRRLPEGSTAADLASSIGAGLARRALIATVNSRPVDLSTPLPDGAKVEIITPRSEQGLHTLRHSTAHVLAQAVLDLYPGATFAMGPPITNGFYYDFELPSEETFSDEDLVKIEARMREIISADQPFLREELNVEVAMEIFADHVYKREIIAKVSGATPAVTRTPSADDSAADVPDAPGSAAVVGGKSDAADVDEFAAEAAFGETLSCYRNGDGFIDLCRGPHVPSTGHLGHFSLQRVAGAYWRGDNSRPMLQRIYGTAWASSSDLRAHLNQLAEAAKRDHRLLARELDLVSWPEELGPGLAIWHPKGAIVRHLMEEYSRRRHLEGGYEFVCTPHLAKSDLWSTSGHLDFFAGSMYPPMELDGVAYYPKPMNCPFHVMIYRARQRSYRDLPLRLFELGTVYRYELSGAVHGLLRSRGFTQDDSHIFAALESVADELASLLEFVLSVLQAFGFEDFAAKLSTRPVGKAVGSEDMWDMATDGLRSALERASIDYTTDVGGGAFYGPKIDVDVSDSLGRAWQLSTLQLDFNLPERFGLTYTASDGERRRPVMIHRALFGSVERFFGVLLEHYAGAFPVWLAPIQVCVLPVAEEHAPYAASVFEKLHGEGFRVELGASDEPLGKRIRNAKLEKVPYVLVVGGDDAAAGTVGVNTRVGKPVRDVPLEDLLARLRADEEGQR